MNTLQVATVTLLLKTPFHIAHGSSDYRENVFLRLHVDGRTAYGEAAVVPYYGVSKEAIIEDLLLHGQQAVQSMQSGHRESLPFRYSMSRSAFCSCRWAWEHQEEPQPSKSGTSYTIAYTKDYDQLLASIDACGFSTIKLKAGFPDDVFRIKLIRNAFPSLSIRLDANQGWSFQDACTIIEQLSDLSISLIEEPISGSPEQLAYLSKLSTIPILLDETVQTSEDIRRYAFSVSGIVVKLAKSGGPYAARESIRLANELGLQVMLSCMIESSLGVLPALYLAPLCTWIDLDAPLLLREDVVTPIRYEDGVPHGSFATMEPGVALLDAFERAPKKEW